jgi:hypothetical protein
LGPEKNLEKPSTHFFLFTFKLITFFKL